MSSLDCGNIGLILLIVIAWLLHVWFYMAEELKIFNSVGSLIVLSHMPLLAGVAFYCKYVLPIAVVFLIGNLYAVFDFFHAMVSYEGSEYLNARTYRYKGDDVSIFRSDWSTVVQHYISYFQFMQEALLISVLITVLWWTSKYNFDNEVKNLWTEKTPTKIVKITLLFVLAVTMSIPFWIIYTV